ncbi:MAG: T9SS type A sorting domain-containing protein [Bacteroidia bacterium]
MKKTIYLLSIILLSVLQSHATKQIVSVANFSFTPSSFTINLGDTVEWDLASGSHTASSLTIPVGAVVWSAPINSSTPTFIYVPAVAGTYNYQCNIHTFMQGSFTVVGCTPPSGQVSASGATTVCKPLSATLNCNATSGAAFQWQKNGVNITTNGNGSSYNATATGSYRVKLTNNCGSTFITNAISVTVNAQPASTITPAGPTTYCKGTTPLTLTANSGAFTYKWKKGTAFISGATAINYQPTATGTYKVEVTNANGCTKLSPGIAVTVNMLPAATITPQGPTTFCAGDHVILEANSGAGLTYQWKKGANNINGATLQTLTATQAGIYKVIVTNSGGCTKTSGGTTVTINCREAVEPPAAEPFLELYPNPASQNINLNFETLDESAQLEIRNITGQLMMQKQIASDDGNFETSLDVSNLPNGIYIMLVKTESGITSKRFVKQ